MTIFPSFLFVDTAQGPSKSFQIRFKHTKKNLSQHMHTFIVTMTTSSKYNKLCPCRNKHRSDLVTWKCGRSPSRIGLEGREAEGKTDRQTHWETDGWIRDRTANRKDRMTSRLIWVTSQLMQRRGDINKAAFPVNDQNNHNGKQKTRNLFSSSLLVQPLCLLCVTFNEI